jgi:hypothetical protein
MSQNGMYGVRKNFQKLMLKTEVSYVNEAPGQIKKFGTSLSKCEFVCKNVFALQVDMSQLPCQMMIQRRAENWQKNSPVPDVVSEHLYIKQNNQSPLPDDFKFSLVGSAAIANF